MSFLKKCFVLCWIFVFIFTLEKLQATSCVVVNSITCTSGCIGSVIANLPGPTNVTFCVNITYTQSGTNWIHGVYINGVPNGFGALNTVTGSGFPSGWDGVGTWLYMPAPAFTSTNSGNLITNPGWYSDRIMDGNPGNNIGDAGTGCSGSPPACSHGFCFNYPTRSCASLGNVNTSGSIKFGFYSDSYSGSWTNNACGAEAPSNSFAYTICCTVNASAGADQAICGGGSVNLTASGGTNYLWSTGASVSAITVSPASTTTYTVTVSDATGCSDVDDVTVSVGTLTVNAGTDIFLCPSVASTPLNGSYANAQTSYTNTTYTNNTDVPIPDVSSTTSTINSAATGGIVTSVCMNISMTWNDDLDIGLTCPGGGTTIDLSSDNGGSGDDYTNVCFTRTAATNVTVMSGVSGNITGNYLPEQSLSLLDGCASNGTWTLNLTDDASFITGTLTDWSIIVAVPSPPTITWSPATNLSATNVLNPTFTNPGPGTYTYTLTVTDNVCTITDQVTITVAGPSLSRTLTNPSCGLSNGSINLTVSGGTIPYLYAWSNAASTEDIASLAAGTYTVTVTDAKSCTATINGTLTAAGVPTISLVTQTNATCPGGSNGALDINVTGGTTPYTYLWSNAATTQDVTGLIAATYTVTVTENGGCTATASYIITQPAAWNVTNVITNVVCSCDATGGVNITVVAGGTPGYTYLWSNSATIQDISSVVDGTYTVTITDSKSCTYSQSYAITEPAQISISLNSQTNVSCFSGCTGSVTISASGGTGPYDFSNNGGASWQFNNVAAPVTYSSLCAGSYTYTVRDANGCLTH